MEVPGTEQANESPDKMMVDSEVCTQSSTPQPTQKCQQVNPKLPAGPPQNSTKKIMCKFFIMGNCIKGENCKYLHSETEKSKFKHTPTIDCPMYGIGYCKNGPICKYKHNKEKEKNFDESSELIPIWYIEHYFDKPISIIFQELENSGSQEVKKLREKYGLNFHQNKSSANDFYSDKKDNIEYILNINKNRTKFYFIKIHKFEIISHSMETNTLVIPTEIIEKFKKKGEKEVYIGIIFDEENQNLSGFTQFKNIIENNMIKVNWMWRTKLHTSKLADKKIVERENGSEISEEIGNCICRMMIKRLSKDEVGSYLLDKKALQMKEASNQDQSKSKTTQKIYITKVNNYNLNVNNNQNYNSNSFISNKRNRNEEMKGYRDYNKNEKAGNDRYQYNGPKKPFIKISDDKKPVISLNKDNRVKIYLNKTNRDQRRNYSNYRQKYFY